MKKLSVIIPVKNRTGLLKRCLESVKAQTYRPLQVVIVDNGSTDDTLSTALAYGCELTATGIETIVLQEPQLGAARARNRGAAAADGEVMAFFDSDDMMRYDYSTSIMHPFNSDPDTELVYWRKMFHSIGGKAWPMHFCNHLSLKAQVVHCILSTQGCAVSRGLFNRAGGWNDSVMRWNDWELGIRYLTALHGKSISINKLLTDIYAQKESITGTGFLASAAYCEGALQAAYKHANSITDSNCRNNLIALLAYKECILGAHCAHEGDPQLGKRLLSHAHKQLHGMWPRIVLRCAYSYTRLGLRGAHLWTLPLITKPNKLLYAKL